MVSGGSCGKGSACGEWVFVMSGCAYGEGSACGEWRFLW